MFENSIKEEIMIENRNKIIKISFPPNWPIDLSNFPTSKKKKTKKTTQLFFFSFFCGSDSNILQGLTTTKTLPKKKNRGTWVDQSVKHLTSAQVMISRSMSLSPVLGSVLTAQSLEPASNFVSPSFSAPSPLTLSISKMNKC